MTTPERRGEPETPRKRGRFGSGEGSAVWENFVVKETDPSYAWCNICGSKIKRGKDSSDHEWYSNSTISLEIESDQEEELTQTLGLGKDKGFEGFIDEGEIDLPNIIGVWDGDNDMEMDLDTATKEVDVEPEGSGAED